MRRLKLLLLLVLPLTAFSQSVIHTIYGTGTLGYLGDGGPAATAQLARNSKVRFDKDGNLYFLHFEHHTVRKVDAATGIISTVAGQGGISGFSGDDSAAVLATLYRPTDLAIDDSGNLYIADNHNDCIRKVNVGTGIITTIGGNGDNVMSSGDGGPAVDAAIPWPTSVCVDHQFNVYVGSNNQIRKIDTAGIITTICGDEQIYPVSGVGDSAINATLPTPSSLFCDSLNNIYALTPAGGYKITNTGFFYHVAGNGVSGYGGDGGPATQAMLIGNDWCMDRSGNIYISEQQNHIRKIDTQGTIYTIVDTSGGFGSFFGDEGDPLAANIHTPNGVATDSCGAVYIADRNNNRIRKVSFPGCGMVLDVPHRAAGQIFSVYPNPAVSELTINGSEDLDFVSITDVAGRVLMTGSFPGKQANLDVSRLDCGLYLLSVNGVIKKFVKGYH